MPDITNDFDNNPNTDERKQRDEDVNNDNLQPEQAESEPELLDQTKSKEFSIPIFAKLYDRCNLKIDELNLKNDKLNAKIEKLNIKKVRSAEFVSTVESMRNVVPMPVYKALSVLSAERRQKIVNINEKIHSHKLNIKSNEQKILNIELAHQKTESKPKTHYFGKDKILGRNKSSKQLQNKTVMKSEPKRSEQEL